MARHEWYRKPDEEIIKVVANFSADLENISKALGGDETGSSAVALDGDVCEKRRCVNCLPCPGEKFRGLGRKLFDSGQHRLFRIVWARQAFLDQNLAGAFIHQGEIGEGATNVETKSIGHTHRGPRASFDPANAILDPANRATSLV